MLLLFCVFFVFVWRHTFGCNEGSEKGALARKTAIHRNVDKLCIAMPYHRLCVLYSEVVEQAFEIIALKRAYLA